MPEIIFLGTSCMLPTKNRNAFSILLRYNQENILIDCGEGTQRQLRQLDISPTKITRVFLSHLHGDHILGLPGLIQTFVASAPEKELIIYGPRKTKLLMDYLLNLFVSDKNRVRIKIKEIESGKIFENNEFEINCAKLEHSITCIGYSLIQKDVRKINIDYLKKFGLKENPLLGDLQKGKSITFKDHKITPKQATYLKEGKKITFILDTKYCKSAINLAQNSDILICESTFTKAYKDKAHEFKHLIAEDAAKIAKLSKSKELILTHFSQRYKTSEEFYKEAKKIFKNVKCVNDLDSITF
ncbi:ribonuclease Z [Candidatus Woesearchaeota archaeon]|nr:ribonuclease Z [Candidatus Woesearchaeota archaeon]